MQGGLDLRRRAQEARRGWDIEDAVSQITDAHINAKDPGVGGYLRDRVQTFPDSSRQDGLCAGGLDAAFCGEDAEVNEFKRWGDQECHSQWFEPFEVVMLKREGTRRGRRLGLVARLKLSLVSEILHKFCFQPPNPPP